MGWSGGGWARAVWGWRARKGGWATCEAVTSEAGAGGGVGGESVGTQQERWQV
jgi:hypothetical protein